MFAAGSGAYVVVTRSGPAAPDADGEADSDAGADAEAGAEADSDGAVVGAALEGAVVGAALEGAVVGATEAGADGDGVAVVPEHAPNAIAATASRLNQRFCINGPPRTGCQ